jgi:hypothetical protein
MKFTYNIIFNYGSEFILTSRKVIAFRGFISLVLGMATYLIVVLLLNVKEVKDIFNTIVYKIKSIL